MLLVIVTSNWQVYLWFAIRRGLQAPCAGIDAGVKDRHQHASAVILRVLPQESERADLCLRHGAREQVSRRRHCRRRHSVCIVKQP